MPTPISVRMRRPKLKARVWMSRRLRMFARHPHDPDARITKMKDGRTHLAHKAERRLPLILTGSLVCSEKRKFLPV